MHKKIITAFQAHNCKDCLEAAETLTKITQNNNAVEILFDRVFNTTGITVDLDAESQNGFSNGAITISHAPLAKGAHDKSLGDRMADSTIFESLNAKRAGDYLAKDQGFEQSGDVKAVGARTAELEVDAMAEFIELAKNTSDNLRTGNMKRALLRLGEAEQANMQLKEHLLDAPHEVQAEANNYMGLPTRQLYIYERIIDSSALTMKEIVLKRIGQKYKMEKGLRTVFKTEQGGELPADLKKLLALFDTGWPTPGRKESRPKAFLKVLQKVQTDDAFMHYRDRINPAQFGFDNPSIVAMAMRQPD